MAWRFALMRYAATIACNCTDTKCWSKARASRIGVGCSVDLAVPDSHGRGMPRQERNCWLQQLSVSRIDPNSIYASGDGDVVLVSASKNSSGFKFFRRTRKEYADVHGYSTFHCFTDVLRSAGTIPDVLAGHHTKAVCLMLAFMYNPQATWMLWTDDDVVINPLYRATPLSLFLDTVPSGADGAVTLVMGKDPGTNTGAFFVRKNCAGWQLMHQWMDVSMKQTFTWSDQTSLRSIIADHLYRGAGMHFSDCARTGNSGRLWKPGVCDAMWRRMVPRSLAGMDQIPSSATTPFYFLDGKLTPQLATLYGTIVSSTRPSTLLLHPAGHKGDDLARLSEAHRDLYRVSPQ